MTALALAIRFTWW